jgi:hypothetical protein
LFSFSWQQASGSYGTPNPTAPFCISNDSTYTSINVPVNVQSSIIGANQNQILVSSTATTSGSVTIQFLGRASINAVINTVSFASANAQGVPQPSTSPMFVVNSLTFLSTS